MVMFLGARNVARIIQSIGLRSFTLQLIEYLRQDFGLWETFERGPRYASHSPNGVIELMPTANSGTFSFKFVNGHPANTLRGLQTVVAFGVLADVETGYPRLLADMTLATAFRTAATSALAARHLARSNCETMALIGLGAQAEFQAHAFEAALGIKRLRVFDIDPRAGEKFARNMSGAGVSIMRCDNAREAVASADIITTITADKKMSTILSNDMVGSGVHINAIGGDCPGKVELARDLLLRANIFVEYAPQTRLEGEIQQLDAEHPVTELWEVIAGHKSGRMSDWEITLFDSVGFAIEDFSVLRLLHDLATQVGIGEEIDLIASPEDPKDLFALLQQSEVEETALNCRAVQNAL
ncbi:ornithine cyclodeaminase [Methylocystis sp. WRRC1]|uniref:ornithine cyclodeaminase n=1 Tax=Methylocystis sp. WRRC1 TaxID=1732014 RepID=UPI001D14202D|nr:ornithine cyclodeaminase [Methylocystis sp. WRRC1]MCC3244827.1 ornithine cyclodeaminase [Methylocystis sp. WRRC1]